MTQSNIHSLNQRQSSSYFNYIREKRARDETFFDALHLAMCPKLTITSFTAIICIIDIVMFIVSLSIEPMQNDEFLQPNQIALNRLGEKIDFEIRHNFQVYRWFLPIFLHASFVHLLFNLVSTLITGSSLEHSIGWPKLCLIYLLGGFGGNLFSSVLNPGTNSVGASTAIFSMIGFYISFLFLNWDAMG